MKRILLSILLLAGITPLAKAQDFEDYDAPVASNEIVKVYKPYVISLGPKVGANFAMAKDPKGLDLINMSGSVGFQAGLMANLRFGRPEGRPVGTERFGVELEVLYKLMSLPNDSKNISLSTIDIPLLFQWYPISAFGVEVGPTFRCGMGASPKYLTYGSEEYETGKLKANDIMVSLGVLYKNKKGFNAGLRFNLGNSDLSKNFQTKVSTIDLSFGWLFPIVK